MGICMCVCVHARVYLFPLPALYHPVTFQSHDLLFHCQTDSCLYLLCLLSFIQVFLSFFLFLSLKNTLKVKLRHIENPKFSVIQCKSTSRTIAKLSLKVKGHLLTIPATFFTSVECHIHVFGVSLSPPEGLTLLRWRVMIFPHQTLPFRRGHSAPLTEFFTKKTHTNTRLYNPSLHAPLCSTSLFLPV